MTHHDDNPIVGIDLGTTNSLVAYADASGPHVIEENGEPMLASVVGFSPDGQVLSIGRDARDHAVERPDTTVHSIKRLMGCGFDRVAEEAAHLPYRVVRRNDDGERDIAMVQIGDRALSPPQISAMILAALKRRAERYLEQPISKAVITVPAYFDDAQRQATRDAGTIAGLDVVRIVNEPTAAALAYGLERRDNTTVAVFDLGGGTFDITLLRLTGDVFEVLSTDGDTHLGGDDFDRAIIDRVIREVQSQFGVQIESPATRQALRNLAEAIKIRLSDESQQTLEIDLGEGRVYRRELDRPTFEQMITPLVDRAIERCASALKSARLATSQVDRVVMVGGSTRIPYVRKRVGEFFGCTPYTAINPDTVVALGAAVQASILAGGRRDMLLLDVTPLSLGIETLGGAMGKLIMKNNKIPCQATETFTTFQDGQTAVKINVLQGERELASDCRSLGEFNLTGIPPMPAGMPKVDVTFLIDQNGILNVSAREQRSGTVAGIQIVPAHGLTRDEVKHITDESIVRAREDMTAHRLIDLRNQVAFDTHKVEKMLDDYGDRLAGNVCEQIRTAMADLRSFAENADDADALAGRLDAFDKQCIPLAETAMSAALQES